MMFNDRYGLTKAVLEGRKTMTRRVIGPSLLDKIESFQDEYYTASLDWLAGRDLLAAYFVNHPEKLPYRVGDVVAVAQSYESAFFSGPDLTPARNFLTMRGVNVADLVHHAGFRNKMFVRPDLMPHQIRITGIRCERLQNISDYNCMREGISFISYIDKYYFERTDREEGFYFHTPREAFASLIDKVSGRGTWDRNPRVLVYEFELEK